jgi:hypothetical protein
MSKRTQSTAGKQLLQFFSQTNPRTGTPFVREAVRLREVPEAVRLRFGNALIEYLAALRGQSRAARRTPLAAALDRRDPKTGKTGAELLLEELIP